MPSDSILMELCDIFAQAELGVERRDILITRIHREIKRILEVATNFGFDCKPFSQSLSSFNRPTKEFERAMLQDAVVMDRNECTRWAFRNVLIKTDAHENQQIVKATNMSKIDPAVSMMMALGGYLTNCMPEFSGI